VTTKSSKDPYTEFEKDIDIEEFRNSILQYFSNVLDPREKNSITYKLEYVFFIILSA